MKKDCCSQPDEAGVNVTVKVDVARIIRCMCISGVLIVAIIFSSKNFKTYLSFAKSE